MDSAEFFAAYNEKVRQINQSLSSGLQALSAFSDEGTLESDIPICDFLKSVTIPVVEQKETLVELVGIENIISAKMRDDDCKLEDNFLDTWNANFNLYLPAKNTTEAIKFALQVYYGLYLDENFIEQYANSLSVAQINLLCFPHRNVTSGEAISILNVEDEEWFDIGILHKYSLKPRDTHLVIELMRDNLLNMDLMEKYSYSEDILNGYMYLTLKQKFDEESYDKAIASGNVSSFLIVAKSGSSTLLELAGHQDFEQIVEVLGDDPLPEHVEVLNKFKDVPYLLDVARAIVGGFHNETFINNYLVEKTPLHDYIATDYGQGLFDSEMLQKLNCNYYLCKAYTVLQSRHLKCDSYFAILSDEKVFMDFYVVVTQLTKALLFNELDKSEYIKYLVGMCLCPELITDVQDADNKPFNHFLISRFLTRLDVDPTGLPQDVGEMIMVQPSGDVKEMFIFSVQDLLLQERAVMNAVYTLPSFRVLPVEDGIAFTLMDAEFIVPELQLLKASSGFTTFAETQYNVSSGDFSDEIFVTGYNILSSLNVFDVPQHLTSLVTDKEFMLNYDLVISWINEAYPEHNFWVSKFSKLYVQLFAKVYCCAGKGLQQLQFLSYVFKVLLKDRFALKLSDKTVLNDLPEDIVIKVSRTPGFTVCSFSDILDRLEDLVQFLLESETVRLCVGTTIELIR